MKTNIILTFLLLNIYTICFLIAQEKEPVVVLPLIGNKLDKVENDHFKLFSQIKGFQEAIFYLNPDSSLQVNIKYFADGGIKDSVIEKYRSFKKMQYYFINFIRNSINDIEEEDKGSITHIVMNDSSETSGELLAVKDNYLLVYKPEYKYSDAVNLKSIGILSMELNEIRKVQISDKTNIGYYIYPTLFGALGALLGSALDNEKSTAPTETKSDKKLKISLAPGLGAAMLGLIVGSISGIILNGVVPLEIGSEALFESPFDDKEIKGLRDKARHREGLPYYLLKVK